MKSLNWSHGRLSLLVCFASSSIDTKLFFCQKFSSKRRKSLSFFIIETSLHKKLLFFKMRLLLISNELLLEVSFLVFFDDSLFISFSLVCGSFCGWSCQRWDDTLSIRWHWTVSGLMFRPDIFSDTTENLFRFRSDFCRNKLPWSKLPI